MRRTKEEALHTRRELIHAARSIFLDKGYSGATLSEIVRLAGLTRGAAYWHFQNKEELYQAVIEDALDRMLTQKNAYAQDPVLSPQEKLLHVLALPLTLPQDYALVNGVYLLPSDLALRPRLLERIRQRKENLKAFFLAFFTQQADTTTLHGTPQTLASMTFLLFEGLYFSQSQDGCLTQEDLRPFLKAMGCFPEAC